jgi:hypothetical protein
MYELTLTKADRDAIDWIGNRYWHGSDLFDLLVTCDTDQDDHPELAPWQTDGDVTFKIPESVAWEMRDKANEIDWLFDCFSDEFSQKLTDFLLVVV